MSCDIHLHLEKRLKKPIRQILKPDLFNEKGELLEKAYTYELKPDKNWSHCSFTKSEDFHIIAVYGMFSVLAGVRNYGDYKQIVPDRGFPKDTSMLTLRGYAYKLWTDDTNPVPEHTKFDPIHYIGKAKAEKYYKSGVSQMFAKDGSIFISQPDWHSPNYCTTEEMEQCVRKIFFEKYNQWNGDFEEWLELANYMKGVEMSGHYECRAVYWFDN